MRHPSPVRLAIPPVLFFLLGVAAPLYAQEDLIQRLRSGIEGVARGMDSVGRKAGSLIGATPLSDDQPAPYTEKREFEQRYPTGAAPMVTVSNEFGEIRVDTWNERVVQVRAEMVTGADSAEKAAQLSKAITINVAPAEDLFEIRTLLPETRGDMGHISISVRYHITIPKDASLVADNYFGDVVARGDVLAELATVRATLVFYETAPRLSEALTAIDQLLPGREVAVARELTKFFEECRRGSPAELIAHYAAHPPKGEIVLVVAPPGAVQASAEEADALLRSALTSHKPSQAAAEVARATGLDRKQLYARALELK